MNRSENLTRPGFRLTLGVYLALVSAAGLAVFVVVLLGHGHAVVTDAPAEFWLFATLLLFSETVRVPHQEDITSSTPFTFALLIISPSVAPVMVAQSVASIVGDVQRRKRPIAIPFNVAQSVLALGAAGAVLRLFSDVPDPTSPHFDIGDMPIIMVAAAVYFVVNNVLAGTATALAEGAPVIPFLRRDLGFQLMTEGAMLSFAPLVVLAVSVNPLMLALMVVPLLAIQKGGEYATLNAHQALHDALTGLPNRLSFSDRVKEALEIRREGSGVAVMIMDLDHFKEINDTLGHHLGDLLLQSVGPRIEEVLRDTDTIARMGGDEFAVLLPDVASPHDAVNVAKKMRGALERPFELEGLALEVGGSIGIAFCPDHGQNLQTLLQRADVAMYIAKRSGSGHAIYAPEHDETSPKRLALASELRGAIEAASIILYYQPIAALSNGEVRGMEALARWRHPKRGLLPPDEFIPLAEQTGLIKPMTLVLLRAALAEVRGARSEGYDVTVSVNISPRHLSDQGLPEDVGRILDEAHADPSWLKLEVTEGTVMSDPGRAQTVLGRLHEMGIRLAIDDFGTGHSSLELLRRLPVEEVKIDKSFVANMRTAVSDGVIVRSTIELGHNLGLTVLAEGVETQEVWDDLAGLGCDLAQGHHLGRPMPADQARAWLRSQAPAPINGAPDAAHGLAGLR